MSVEVLDEVGILEPGELAQLGATPSRFAVVATVARTDGPQDSAARAKACVDRGGPASVCIVLDPLGGFSSTEFGDSTGIGPATEKQAARAGNPDFREGRWAEGLSAIVGQTEALGARPVASAGVSVVGTLAIAVAAALAVLTIGRRRLAR